MDVVHGGWLVKSPPEKRILKAKWRQRWFVLRHSGNLPGQFILEYFTDDSCRKLKGKIDLDQCEQVDAGLTFEGKKTNYQYMFDIRTPKRIYYLVAETEADMNKWVDCICSVCGLKIHVDDDYLAQESGANNATTTAATPTSTLAPSKSSSNPYIPISECHTGKPVLNGNVPNEAKPAELLRDAPVPLPPTSARSDWSLQDQSLLKEFYDIPRPAQPVNGSEIGTDLETESSYNVPPSLRLPTTGMDQIGSRTLPPRVNWDTHPNDVVPLNRAQSLRRDSTDKNDPLAAYDIVPPLHSTCKKVEAVRKEAQELASELERAGIKEPINSSQVIHGVFRAPPRPPKPSKLRDSRHDYENFEPIKAAQKTEISLYDIPQPPKEVPKSVLSGHNNSETKKENANDSAKVPLSSSSEEKRVDDMYDFPKFRSEDNINATVPLQGTGTAQRQRRHAYTNAPPGLFNSKDLIFNYEYRPSLLNDYVNMDANAQEPVVDAGGSSLGAAAQAPSSSTMAQYANLPPASPSLMSCAQGDAPPVVNRGLKPNRSAEKSQNSASFLTLQPPPLYKTRANKRSFRKPGESYIVPAGASHPIASALNMTPPVPNRFRHQIPGIMDDDFNSVFGSRSLTDIQGRHHFMNMPIKKDEIQYLDLDLDSEPSPSPKSPERVSATVYKKVDFIKTEAFNKMRQNVEETYRKSQ